MRNILLTFLFVSYSGLSVADEYLEKLNAISEYAEKICNTLPLSGERKHLNLTVEAKAELEGLFSKIADIGAGAKGVYEDESFKGVVQEDLKDLFISNADCKNKVSERLENKLLSVEVYDKKGVNRSEAIRSNPVDDYVPVATNWLSIVDSGNYSKAYKIAAASTRADYSETFFVKLFKDYLSSLGKVTRREPTGANSLKKLSTGQTGNFRALLYKTKFESGHERIEVLTLVAENGTWKVKDHSFYEQPSLINPKE